MSDFTPLLTSKAGIDWSIREEDNGKFSVRSETDVTAILESNQAQASHNNGYTPDKSWRRCATIPIAVQLKWMIEEGWDCLSPDPDCQKKLAQKLDSSEYHYLRTAEFRIGDHYKHHI